VSVKIEQDEIDYLKQNDVTIYKVDFVDCDESISTGGPVKGNVLCLSVCAWLPLANNLLVIYFTTRYLIVVDVILQGLSEGSVRRDWKT
jgi:hypothetical protein